ncbi:MAG: hypothetical protein AAFR45_06290 [Pseudomonadota bacterium]
MTQRLGISPAVSVLVSAGLLAACDDAALSQSGITGEVRQDYLAAVASVGCVLNDERQYGAVEFQADITRDQTIEITQYYLRRGLADRIAETEAIRIKAGPCAV